MSLFIMELTTVIAFLVLLVQQNVLACVEELLKRTDASQYGYTAFDGPSTWSATWSECSGPRQSPVMLNICTEDMSLPSLIFHGHADVRPAGFRLHNTYQSVEVQYSGDAPLLWGGPLQADNFSMAQVHFHWGPEGSDVGSEHVFLGTSFVLEAHIVHFNAKYGSVEMAAHQRDGLVVVSILFQAAPHDVPDMETLVGHLKHVRQGGSYALVEEGAAMTWIRPHVSEGAGYVTYRGSLTTPPCSQTVTWIVLETTASVSLQQLREFRALRGHVGAIFSNRRPLQNLANRLVRCSRGSTGPHNNTQQQGHYGHV